MKKIGDIVAQMGMFYLEYIFQEFHAAVGLEWQFKFNYSQIINGEPKEHSMENIIVRRILLVHF